MNLIDPLQHHTLTHPPCWIQRLGIMEQKNCRFGFMAFRLTRRAGCRHVKGDKPQIQLNGKTRFSSFAVLIESLQRHHHTLYNVVTSPAYARAAGKAAKKGVWVPPDDDVPFDLQRAEQILEDAETGLYNARAMPATLTGLKKFAVVYQDVTCQRFWDALEVWPVFPLGSATWLSVVAVSSLHKQIITSIQFCRST
jgi:hypothetical protein